MLIAQNLVLNFSGSSPDGSSRLASNTPTDEIDKKNRNLNR